MTLDKHFLDPVSLSAKRQLAFGCNIKMKKHVGSQVTLANPHGRSLAPLRHNGLRCSLCLTQAMGTALVPLPPVCALLFAICLAGGCCLPSESHLLPSPGSGLSKASLRTMQGSLLGPGSSLCFVSAWPPLSLTARPRWARGRGSYEGCRRGGFVDRNVGDREKGWPPRLSRCSPQALVSSAG